LTVYTFCIRPIW